MSSRELDLSDCDHCIERLKSELLVDLSHEFRTPLTLILGPLRDLEAGSLGELPAAALDQIGLARRSAERLQKVVGQILDTSRLEAGRLRLEARHGDLGKVLTRLAESFRPLAERRGLRFDFQPPAVAVPIWADPDQLHKVFANLLSNAMRYAPSGGRVEMRVEVAAAAGTAAVTVRDDGPGVAAEDRERIFDRYYRAARLANRKGSGLGLPLARQLAELHGGRLTLENEPGEGAVFRAELRLGRDHLDPDQIVEDAPWRPPAPAAEAEGARPASPAGISPASAGAAPASPAGDPPDRTTVLVVDDHADIRAYVRGHLEPGYRVEEAGDGAEGLARARDLLPDLVVSDVMMPEMDGHALCCALKQDPELDWVPVILLTARAALDDKLEGLDGGADAYLTKPFDARELTARVDNLIASRRRLRRSFASGNGHRRLRLRPAPGVRLEAGDRQWLEAVASAVDAGLGEESFTVEDLAERLAIHRTRLFRRLRRLIGLSPVRLILRRRLERAAELLAAEGASVSEAAYGAGFHSVAHFSRRFQELYGRAPSAWRRGAARSAARRSSVRG